MSVPGFPFHRTADLGSAPPPSALLGHSPRGSSSGPLGLNSLPGPEAFLFPPPDQRQVQRVRLGCGIYIAPFLQLGAQFRYQANNKGCGRWPTPLPLSLRLQPRTPHLRLATTHWSSPGRPPPAVGRRRPVVVGGHAAARRASGSHPEASVGPVLASLGAHPQGAALLTLTAPAAPALWPLAGNLGHPMPRCTTNSNCRWALSACPACGAQRASLVSLVPIPAGAELTAAPAYGIFRRHWSHSFEVTFDGGADRAGCVAGAAAVL